MDQNVKPNMLAHTRGRLNGTPLIVLRLSLLLMLVSLQLFLLPREKVLASEPQQVTQHREANRPLREASVLSRALIQVAQQAHLTVVHITIKTKLDDGAGRYESFPFLDNPFPGRLLDKSIDPQEEVPLPDSSENRTASGVIIRPNGYIMTNNHVVDGAYDIRIQLADNRILPAKVVGQDPQTDLAVLKINAEKLPVVRWGDSGHLKVGEIVVAVGNPFGLNQTVTMGIISAIGRANFDHVDLESFIQTDATIIPGNPGGALLNLNGELIGINTALLRENRGEMGIGFAIPSQMIRTVSTLLIQQGKVTRGWMGVATQKLTPELAKQFKAPTIKGVVITDLAKDGPAGLAQFQRRDIIRTYQGTPIIEPRQLRSLVAETKPGTSITITRIRDGKEKDIAVTIGEFTLETNSPPNLKPANDVHLLAGVTVEPIPKDFLRGKDGILVSAVIPGSLADNQGLEEGDVILDINQVTMRSIKDFERLQGKLGRKDSALLLLRRENATMFLSIH